MTPLAKLLAERIRVEGPIPLSEYMAECLGHPQYGYYMTRDPLGANGDFTTSPEISQMFGELIGLWLADQWIRQDYPSPLSLIELGPGRGTLMRDALRAMASVPKMIENTNVHFVETSPVLRELQRKLIPDATWHETLGTVPPGPTFLIANEFFDALPIDQAVWQQDGWKQRQIGFDEHGFKMTYGPPLDLAVAPPNAPDGTIFEFSETAEAIMIQIAERVELDDGAALIIDYGHAQSGPGETLQAMRDHVFAGLFDSPGECDLTAHVNFARLKTCAETPGNAVFGPVSQGEFLTATGIDARAAQLANGKSSEQAVAIEAARHRLTNQSDPRAMGALFKVMAILPEEGAIPAGFEGTAS